MQVENLYLRVKIHDTCSILQQFAVVEYFAVAYYVFE